MRVNTEAIRVEIDGRRIVDGVTIEADRSEFVGILGPNGSGKSTLLKTIYRVLEPTGGAVYLDGRPLKAYSSREIARSVGVMTQNSDVCFDFTVEEIVLMGRSPYKRMLEFDREEDYKIAESALDRVGLLHLRDQKFNTLSGGEQQRVLFARVLTQNPKVFLLDEPMNHMDIQYQMQMLRLVRELHKETIMVLHDINMALNFCDRIYLMKDGEVAAFGTPREVMTESRLKDVFGVNVLIREIPELNRLYAVVV